MKQKLSAFVILILALAMGTISPRTQTRVDVPQRVTDRVAAGNTVSVIVGVDATFVPEGDLPGVDSVASQRDVIARVLDDVMTRAAGAGITVGSSYEILPFFTARVDRAGLEALATMSGVTSIEENRPDRAHLASSVPIVAAPAAWAAGHTGAGWTVAVLDTGIEKTHSFLTGKVVSEACYVNAGGTSTGAATCPGGTTASIAVGSGLPCSVASDCSHGTHVAGIATGANAPGGVNGVAPGASLFAMQVFTRFDDPVDCDPDPAPCTGSFPSDQVLALNRVAALAGAGNVNKVAAVNMSLGGGNFFDQAACDAANQSNGRKAAIDNLRSLGIAVVASSGNNGFKTSMGAPGCISSAVSVGSVTDALAVSSFSNNAPFLSLYGPGSSVTSSVQGNTYASFNGTSMAAPHVAGAWAILKQALPGATVTAALAALQSTGTTINDTRTGGGAPHPLINVNAARVNLLGGGGGGGGVPGAPTSFAITGSGNALHMTWTPPVVADEGIAAGAATGYTLLARVVSGGPIVLTLPLGNVTAFDVAAPNGTFFVSVQGTNASGAGPESNVVPITVPVVGALPGNPTNLQVSVNGNSAVFTWTAPTSGGPVGDYVLIAGQTPGFATPLATLPLPASPTIFGIAGIPPGIWYARIHARNAGGLSAQPTNEVQLVVAGPTPPGAPTLNAPTVSGNNVGLSWAPGIGGAPTSYTLVAALSPGGAPIATVPGLTATSLNVPGVPSGTYFVRIGAVNALGASPPSNEVTVVVP